MDLIVGWNELCYKNYAILAQNQTNFLVRPSSMSPRSICYNNTFFATRSQKKSPVKCSWEQSFSFIFCWTYIKAKNDDFFKQKGDFLNSTNYLLFSRNYTYFKFSNIGVNRSHGGRSATRVPMSAAVAPDSCYTYMIGWFVGTTERATDSAYVDQILSSTCGRPVPVWPIES